MTTILQLHFTHNTESQTMSESHGILWQTGAITCWHNVVQGRTYAALVAARLSADPNFW